MLNHRKLHPGELASLFKKLTRCKAPDKIETYESEGESPVRAVAEYEEMGGVLIAYPGTETTSQVQLPPSGARTFGIPNDLIVRMQQVNNGDREPVHIFILCADFSQRSEVIADLRATAEAEELDFDPNLIHFVLWDTDSYWTRDYGPWWVKNETTGYFGIAKHLYTSLGGGSVGLVQGSEDVFLEGGGGIFRPNDDYAATKFSDYLNVPIRAWNEARWGRQKLAPIKDHNWYNTGLLNVGGNYMSTSNNVVASSYLVATQNELPVDDQRENEDNPSSSTIEDRMKYILGQFNRFMGTTKYHVITDPSGTYIGHIDCWAKFLADDKIIIAESPNRKINDAYDDIADFFEEQGFHVTRVFCPNILIGRSTTGLYDIEPTTAPYTNSLILNNYVYVPIVGGDHAEDDENALEAYRGALGSDYTVVGIIGKPELPWLGTDALHCRTRSVPREIVDNWLKSLTQRVVPKR
ncbi:MAG: agmatine deiminase family protein [Cyanobacteria bacterium SBLK]|nr:agmatine deiminase family protein [Cyanobacteria bacterium SBLK]